MRFECKLDDVLKQKNMSLNQLHIQTGIPRQTLTEYRKDRTQRYGSEILAKICTALEISIDDLLVLKKENLPKNI